MILSLAVALAFFWLFVDDARGNPHHSRRVRQRRTLAFGVEIPVDDPAMRDSK